MAGLHESRATAAPSCLPADAEPATVRGVEPDGSLRLADDRLVRLAGIALAGDTPTRPDGAATIRSRLSAWLAGRTVVVGVPDPAPDRWGRLAAVVEADPETPASGDERGQNVALRLLAEGAARARPEPAATACWAALLAGEAPARTATLGVWGDPYYAVRVAEAPADVAAADGRFAVIEGRITHLGQSRTQRFVDLGPPHAGVALRMPRRLFIAGQAGMGQDDMRIGRRLRVRGVVEDGARGPQVFVKDADQVEWIEDTRPAPEARSQ